MIQFVRCAATVCGLAFVSAVLWVLGQASLKLPATHAQSPSSTANSPGNSSGDLAATVDWPQWGGTSLRNNTPVGYNIPTDWEIGDFDFQTGDWDPTGSKNIKWVSKLGSQTYGNAVVADGLIYVGTNNSSGWLKRYPAKVDLGCLLCFDAETGKFMWQHSSEKLPSGRVHDWPLQGICCAPLVEGDRLWFVTSRGEVQCLDTAGFRDNENDGPYKDEPFTSEDEADTVWVFDMMKSMGISQHNMCSCSVTSAGDLLFVNTSNGVDVEHNYIPAPDAPSFFAINKHTGKVVWTDSSPGLNILHGQWSSPCYAVIDGQPQVIFPGGDGWIYSFDPQGGGKTEGKSRLLWKFDANPKTSLWELGGRGTRNNVIATPVVHQGRVYVAVGQDPEHGEGDGHLWCIDPTKRGDISPELVFNAADPNKQIEPKRLQSADPKLGDLTRPNPNSGAIWHYSKVDSNEDGEIDFEETIHRSCGTVAIKDNILYIADFSGLLHCLDATSGKVHWTYDMLAAAWGTPLIVEDKVYIGDEDGEVAIFRHSSDPNIAMREVDDELVPYFGERNMGNSVYSTLIVAGNVLYVSNRTHLFAIVPEE
jgi:outer membrane protein assembly factor BamB